VRGVASAGAGPRQVGQESFEGVGRLEGDGGAKAGGRSELEIATVSLGHEMRVDEGLGDIDRSSLSPQRGPLGGADLVTAEPAELILERLFDSASSPCHLEPITR
jgi:hypothetical protein